MNAETANRPNPYVGPRAFLTGETLYGRTIEAQNLLDSLIARRIVLLYSPSGAGKTSLIQASLIPMLKEEGFHVLPVMRVNHTPDPDLGIPPAVNRYIFSLLISLEEELPPDKRTPLAELAEVTLVDYLHQRAGAMDGQAPEVLIFDQFEEILTVDPTDEAARKSFFEQVGEALRDSQRWALFSMREEYCAGLDPYLRPVPTGFRTKFRLELLVQEAACQAMQEPASLAGVEFKSGAAKMLADDLRRVWVQGPDGTKKEKLGPHIEPVQLQVVCCRLWEELRQDDDDIGEDDVKSLGDVDSALAAYYSQKTRDAASKTGESERAVREWFDRHLITDQGIRGMVLQGPQNSQGLNNDAIRLLVDAHLVRAEKRLGATWFELSHDRLIEPVRTNNATWRETHLSSLQRRAALWAVQNRPADLLLQKQDLLDAERWAEDNPDQLAAVENDFLTACQEFRAVAQREQRQARRIRLLTVAAVALLVMFLALVSYNRHALWLTARPWGYFKNLSTGKIHSLKGNSVIVGRSTDRIRNEIDLRNNYISRLHLRIFRDFLALDMRTTNGTSVDAVFLPYDDSRKLNDGSIVVLAGIAPFQFQKIKYAGLQFWTPPPRSSTVPSDGDWGVFIDGGSRSIIYLRSSVYFISKNAEDRVVIGDQAPPHPLGQIKKWRDGDTQVSMVTVLDHEDQDDLIISYKKSDYEYPEGTFQNYDFEMDGIGFYTFMYGEAAFQIVALERDMESSDLYSE
jgi:Novel STAND NTPase 1/FHA domain